MHQIQDTATTVAERANIVDFVSRPDSEALAMARAFLTNAKSLDDLFANTPYADEAALAYGALEKYDTNRFHDAAKERFGPTAWKTNAWKAQVRKVQKRIQGNDTEGDDEKKPNQATQIIAFARRHATFFRDENNGCYAKVNRGDHTEIMNLTIAGGRFKAWLIHAFEQHVTTPSSSATSSAMQVLYAQALVDSPTEPVHRRFGATPDKEMLVLDLCDDSYRVVVITKDGWRVTTESPINFVRENGMLPMPAPVTGGKLSDLYPFLHARNEIDKLLEVAWLLGTFHPTGPYPVLPLVGPAGGGKTTTQRVLRRCSDHRNIVGVAEIKDEHDLAIMAEKNHVVAFENLSRISPEMSDAICRLATGSGHSTRANYTDRDEVLFSACRPVIINSIESLATRGDLIDRAIIIDMPRINDHANIPETQFWTDFEAAWPKIMGAIFDAVVMGLSNYRTVQGGPTSRMIDFAHWITAMCPALGVSVAKWGEAYSDNRQNARLTEIEASEFGAIFVEWVKQQVSSDNYYHPVHKGECPAMERGIHACSQTRVKAFDFFDSGKELLHTITKFALVQDDSNERRVAMPASWPKSPEAMGGQLKRLNDALKAVGIKIIVRRTRTGNTYTVDWEHFIHGESYNTVFGGVNYVDDAAY